MTAAHALSIDPFDAVSGVRPLAADDVLHDIDGILVDDEIIWHSHRPVETLGASVAMASAALGVSRDGDDVEGVCAAVGTSPLRAAAWLRSRGAAVGHAASRARLASTDGSAYAAAARTVISRSGKTSVSLGEIRSRKLGAWLTSDRVAIVLVGADWPTCRGNDVHAVVVVGAGSSWLTVFDPAGRGSSRDISFDEMDATRADPNAAWEVLLAARRH